MTPRLSPVFDASHAFDPPSQETYDVVVAGSGAAGLSAALTAARRGLSVLLVEKASVWGGSTAKSAGMVWVPGNPVIEQVGGHDTAHAGRAYMKATVGDCTSDEMIDAFLTDGAATMTFLTESCPGLEFRHMEGYPDYWLEAPGAARQGRGVEAGAFDTRRLGGWADLQMAAYFKPAISMDLNSFDSADLLLSATHPRPIGRAVRLVGRNLPKWVRGEQTVTMGAALTAALMHAALAAGVEVRLGTSIAQLSFSRQRCSGVVVDQRAGRVAVAARGGVVLACGGFERNAEMRRRYQRHPINAEWTVGAETNTGDGIELGLEHGAAIDNMGDAIWSPVIRLPKVAGFTPIVIDDEERFIVPDRSLPHTLIVNGEGNRFMNEALPYCTAGQGLYGGPFGKGEGEAENLPAWLIFDQKYRDTYPFAYSFLPRKELPDEFYESGAVVRRATIEELGDAIGVPALSLRSTIERFNSFARDGVDHDFHRGEDEHDRFYANRYHKPNPSLGEVKEGPFYATRVYPGDIGTSGGLVIDTQARVTRPDGSAIEGLYAAGNTTKSVIGHTYCAGGTSIGAALVFGHIAANSMADGLGQDVAGALATPAVDYLAEVDLSGIDVDTSRPALVTGANGYVASWIVAALLWAGVDVHAAVRDPDNRDKVAHLLRAADGAPGKLTLFAADLLTEGSYTEAMRGCGVVFHTASPFVRHVADPQRDLVDPALKGTRNVLASADVVADVQRVVLTSSMAAICTDANETQRAPGRMLDETAWNSTASLTYEPYYYSKTVAEREARRMADAQDRWRLVVVNPALVMGPALGATPTSESFAIMRQLAGGDMRFGAPRLGLAVVDVRDVARAQIAAAYLPDAHGRNIISAGATDIATLGYMLLPDYADSYPLPRWALPKRLFWAIAPLVGVSRRYASGNVGHTMGLDNSKSRRELGMTYRPIETSVREMFAHIARHH